MEVKLNRMSRAVPVTIGTDTTTATVVRLEDSAGVALLVGPLTASVTVNVYGGGDQGSSGGVFADGGSVFTLTLTTATNSSIYALPDGLLGAQTIRLVGSATVDGTVVMKT